MLYFRRSKPNLIDEVVIYVTGILNLIINSNKNEKQVRIFHIR